MNLWTSVDVNGSLWSSTELYESYWITFYENVFDSELLWNIQRNIL